MYASVVPTKISELSKYMKVRIVYLAIAFSLVLSLAAVMIFPANTVQAQTTWQVNPGDDIQAAINNASPGDTIQFAVGTYSLPATLLIDKTLTLTSADCCLPSLPRLDGGGTLVRIILIDADNVTIKGLEVANGTGDLIRQSAAHTGTVVTQCIVHDSNSAGDEGIQLTNCTNCVISNNLVYDVEQDAIAVSSNSVNCQIISNEIYDSRSENGAIFVYDSYSITIRGNYIHDTTAAAGIKFDDSYSGTFTIDNNLIVNNSWQGGKRTTEEADGNSIVIYEPRLAGTYNIEHNTISDNTGFDGGPNPTGNGIYLNDGRGVGAGFVTNIDDNIITNHNGYGIRTWNWGTGAIVNYSYNDIWNNTDGITDGNPIDGGNNISADPLFNPDYSLPPGSPAYGTASDSTDRGVDFDTLLQNDVCDDAAAGAATGVPVFPTWYIGIAAALGAGIIAYMLRRRVLGLKPAEI